MNAIAPWLIATPMNPEENQAVVLALGDAYPIPAYRAGYMCGAVIFIDDGTEAAVGRGDSSAPRAVGAPHDGTLW